MEGEVELSLGCLKLVLNSRERDDLEFPLVLQVLDSSTIRYLDKPTGPLVSGQIISVSDGFYKRTDCFVVLSDSRIPTFSLILIKNIDFHIKYQRNRDRVPITILGQILEYQILVNGTSIGLFSGTPISLDQFKRGSVEMRNPLAGKLWAQVKEGKCCDVTFRFPSLPGEPTVEAQMNALVAQSDVFEVLFQSAFLEKTGVVKIYDSEPKYIKSLIQFVFTQFIPLLSLKQAFEVLYLANKYLIKDLDKFCRNFIINNKAKKTLPKDVFKYMELNQKCCDDQIHDFIIQEFANHTNILIRQPKFLTLSLENVEMFFSLLNLNAQDWELLHALR
ncbi:uncharacterized protein LOC111702495 [Eurytemora carolleeae]|uniref:uncharacterized protein LOC111702495 n=1 Tax=Eurytemora carolleeae TaxID=1294199 RepID=UPI000C7614C6|nr:uncharacterized protein LOC111702495 [Eurytemora carolleeae]|eukprot:XP_023329971.1 uncharacterized protein LOC111702495 [Eurytemora affinis]